MENYEIIGYVAIGIAALIALYASVCAITKPFSDKLSVIEQQLIKINTTLENYVQKLNVIDARLDKHGSQIDDLRERMIVLENKKEQD